MFSENENSGSSERRTHLPAACVLDPKRSSQGFHPPPYQWRVGCECVGGFIPLPSLATHQKMKPGQTGSGSVVLYKRGTCDVAEKSGRNASLISAFVGAAARDGMRMQRSESLFP